MRMSTTFAKSIFKPKKKKEISIMIFQTQDKSPSVMRRVIFIRDYAVYQKHWAMVLT